MSALGVPFLFLNGFFINLVRIVIIKLALFPVPGSVAVSDWDVVCALACA